MTKQQRTVLETLSLQVFGTKSGYTKLLRGVPVQMGPEKTYALEYPTVDAVLQFMNERLNSPPSQEELKQELENRIAQDKRVEETILSLKQKNAQLNLGVK